MALKLVQVGFGAWGRDWAARVRDTPEVRVVGVADALPEAARAAGALYGLEPGRCFTALGDALTQTAAEAVLVTAGAAAHAPLARTALEAGKHVLVEKPFALTLGGAQALVEAAEAGGLTLMVSQNYRFSWRRGLCERLSLRGRSARSGASTPTSGSIGPRGSRRAAPTSPFPTRSLSTWRCTTSTSYVSPWVGPPP